MEKKNKNTSITRDPVTGEYSVAVTRAERQAARLRVKVDAMEGRTTPAHIKAIAEAKPAAKTA